MPEKAKVTVYYGPYDCFGYVEFRECRLEGLRDILERNEHQVALKRIQDRDAVVIIVNDSEVFRCKVQQLNFGGDGDLDPLCQEILAAVNKAY